MVFKMSKRAKVAGLYIQTHKVSGAFYIGVSEDVYRTVAEDLRRLNNNFHNNAKLQELFNRSPIVDTDIRLCFSIAEAQKLKRDMVVKHYSDPLLLNQRNALNVCAVYRITHEPSGFFYIGSSKDFAQRKRVHESTLRKGKHMCPKLQELFNEKPDFSLLKWDIILAHPIEHAHFLEEKMITDSRNNPLLLNKADSAKGTKGVHYSGEEKSRRSTLAKQLWAEGRMRDPSVSGASKKVSIDGNIYDSVVAASKQLNLATHHIYRRVKSDEWPSYQYL